MALTSNHEVRLSDKNFHSKGCVTKHAESFLRTKKSPNFRCSYKNQGYLELVSEPRNKHYNIDFRSDEAARKRLLKEFKGKKRIGYVKYTRKDKVSDEITEVTGSVSNPLDSHGAWHIGKKDNFKVGYLPYHHAYHHIMPWEAIKKTLNFREARLLQKSKYNINAGNNLIILPREDKFARIMALVSHSNNHETYTMQVQLVINLIRFSVEEQSEQHKKGEDKQNTDFKKMLEDWQEETFDMIIGYGKIMAASDGKLAPDLNAMCSFEGNL